MSLPQIQVSPNLYTILKIVFMVSAFAVVAFNVLSISVSALPENTTDWNFGLEYCDCELVDDDKEEDLEEEDEKEHEEESREHNNNN